jgi:hypothetical protein
VIGAQLSCGAVQIVTQVSNGLQVGLEHAVLHGLTPQEWQAVTLALYEQTGLYADRAPFDWEGPWFDSVLPEAGRALIVGGGGGAEAMQLAERGWVVHTTDGTGQLSDHARTRLQELDTAHKSAQVTFEQLAAWRLDGAARPDAWACADMAESYDVALVGWGALSHIPRQDDRARLLSALGTLCPSGPILFSSICVGATGSARSRSRVGHALGLRAGKVLASMRGLSSTPAAGDRFFAHVGYGHEFTVPELRGLAMRIGRNLQMDNAPNSYPHGRFVVQEV